MDRWRVYAEVSSAGIGFLAAVLIGVWAGQWLDGQLGTGGLMTITLIFIGVLGAVFNLLRVVQRINDGKRGE